MKPHETLIKEILKAIGEDPEREGLLDTPARVVRSWGELFGGYKEDPWAILKTVFKEGACNEMVVLRDIPFNSMCEHHMLPFLGVAHVGYIPGGYVVGLSKLARLVDCFAHRLQIQENLTTEIAEAIAEHLRPKGVAVVIEAHHQCMSCRGVRKSGTTMVTSAIRGVFREKPEVRAEFLAFIRSGR
jgi:GTP cyclohydrolase I